MRKNKLFLTMLTIVLIAALVLSGCGGGGGSSSGDTGNGDQGGGEVIIGYVGPMTGPSATMGTATKLGAELAIEEINAAGGIMGNTIKFVTRDDEADPTKSKTAVEELIDKEKV